MYYENEMYGEKEFVHPFTPNFENIITNFFKMGGLSYVFDHTKEYTHDGKPGFVLRYSAVGIKYNSEQLKPGVYHTSSLCGSKMVEEYIWGISYPTCSEDVPEFIEKLYKKLGFITRDDFRRKFVGNTKFTFIEGIKPKVIRSTPPDHLGIYFQASYMKCICCDKKMVISAKCDITDLVCPFCSHDEEIATFVRGSSLNESSPPSDFKKILKRVEGYRSRKEKTIELLESKLKRFELELLSVNDNNITNKVCMGSSAVTIDLLVTMKCIKGNITSLPHNAITSSSTTTPCRCGDCKTSNESYKLVIIEEFLKKHKIAFEREKSFRNLYDKGTLRYDIWIPKFNIIIEYDDAQHFTWVPYFHKTENDFLDAKRRDNIKTQYAVSNLLNLLRINHLQKDYINVIGNFINDVKSNKNAYTINMYGKQASLSFLEQ